MSTSSGWEALRAGDAQAARQQFEQALRLDDQDFDATLGLAKALMILGDPDSAQPLVLRLRALHDNIDAKIARAELLSHQGKRNEAIATIRQAQEQHPLPYLGALHAEQRIRQGYWDEGSDLFIQAIGKGVDRDAFSHLIKVVADVSDAVAQGRIRPTEALAFINRVDNFTPSNSPQTKLFFATARRAISQSQALPSPDVPVTLTRHIGGGGGGGSARSSSPPPTPSRRGEAQTRSEPARRQPLAGGASPARRQLNEGLDVDVPELRMGASTPFMELMREDRRTNEQLQQLVTSFAQLDTESWPSDRRNDLDTIPALVNSGTPISEQFDGLQSDPFRVTDGSIFSELYVERALQAIILRVPAQLAGTILIHPSEVSWLELNATDGMLDDIELVTIDLDLDDTFTTHAPPREVALGAFLGHAITRHQLGVWDYDNVPEHSVVRVGDQTFEPFAVAKRWFASSSREDVSLVRFIASAREAVPKSRFVPLTYEYIDLTKDLTGLPLRVRLGELWSTYLTRHASVAPSEISNDVEVVHNDPNVVVLTLPKRWCPELGASVADGWLDGERLALAYLRRTGEFMFTARAPSLEVTLDHLAEDLTSETVGRVLEFIARYHCPRAALIMDPRQAARAAQISGQEVSAPVLREGSKLSQVTFWTLRGKTAQQWTLRHDDDAVVMRWTLAKV